MKRIKVYFHQKKEHRERQKDTYRYAPERIEKISPLNKNEIKKDHINIKKKNKVKILIIGLVVNYLPMINFSRLNDLHKEADFVYCWSTLPWNSKKPYIVELDNPYTLTYYNYFAFQLYKPIIRKILKSKKCHKIVCISEACKRDLIKELGDSFKNKVMVQYPYVKDKPINKNENKRTRLLFVGKDFKRKGGPEILEAFKRDLKDDITLDIVGIDFSKKIKFSMNITNYGIIERNKILTEIYPNSDVLVFPSYHETFGMVALEALSFGLGIIAMDTYALPEIVNHKSNGEIINNPYCSNPVQIPIKKYSKKYLKRKFDKNVVDSLYQAILNAKKNKDKWKEESIKIYKEKFSEKVWKKNYMEMFK